MEKLQSALEKARSQRGDGGTAARQFTGPQRSPGQDKTATLWHDLQQFSPKPQTLKRNRILTAQSSAAATPFDILRTKVLLQMQQNKWTRLAITSPMPTSGKTTNACNLALAFGRQHGMRTMLFDFDLRSPSIYKVFDFNEQRSISDLLEGRRAIADHAVRIGENVAVVMSDQKVKDSSRTLLSEETEITLDKIQSTYAPDVMIFDMPSVLVSDDTRAFLKNVDCALIVVRANKTRYAQFDRCEREVSEHTNVIGTVVNAYHQGGVNADMG